MKAMNCLFALLACLAFVSCESEDAPETYQTELPYLELVIPQSREDNFKNADIMEEANKRVKPYVKIENGHIELTLKSGKEINVSDEIYEMFVEGTRKNNILLQEGKIYVHDGRLIYNK